MDVRKFRWSRVYESTEEELLEIFAQRSLDARLIIPSDDNEPIAAVPEHACMLWCSEGSLTVTTANDEVSMQAGDVLHIGEYVPYEIQAGFMGYRCYLTEASDFNF